MQVPMYQGQGINTNVAYGSRSSGTIMEVASAAERLSARLSGAAGNVAQLAEPQIKEETIQAALKDVQEGRIDSERVALVARDVYKNTANSALIADVEVSGNQLAKQIENQMMTAGKYDTAAFAKSWGTYTKATLGTIKDLAIKQNVAQKLAHIGTQYSGSIGTLQAKQQREIQTKNFQAKLTMDAQNLKKAFSNNAADADKYTAEVQTTLQTMVDAGLMAPAQAELKYKEIEKSVFTEYSLKEFQNTDDKTAFLERFRNNDYLSVEDTDKAIDQMHKILRSQINDTKIMEDFEEEKAEKFKTDSKESLYRALASGTLTKDMLDNSLGLVISTSEYDDLYDRMQTPSVTKSDSSQYKHYLIHLDQTTKEIILNDPLLSDPDKLKLVNEFESKEKEFMSEARSEIDRHFKIFAGTIFSKADINNDNTKDYSTVRSMFFDEVQDLPADEAFPKTYVKIARDLLSKYEKGELVGTSKFIDSTKKEEPIKEEPIKEEPIKGQNAFMKWIRNW